VDELTPEQREQYQRGQDALGTWDEIKDIFEEAAMPCGCRGCELLFGQNRYDE
jgi:hypothetical protein